MSEPTKDKAEENVNEQERDIKKTPEYRRFRKLLKQVVKSPPMKRSRGHG
jgi:hypothetical protein